MPRGRRGAMPCTVCGAWIDGWATYQYAGAEDGWVVICEPCGSAELHGFAEPRTQDPWILRVKCCMCVRTTQSCLCKGSGPVYCLRLYGWQRSASRNKKRHWYCPDHAKEHLAAGNDSTLEGFMACECIAPDVPQTLMDTLMDEA